MMAPRGLGGNSYDTKGIWRAMSYDMRAIRMIVRNPIIQKGHRGSPGDMSYDTKGIRTHMLYQ